MLTIDEIVYNLCRLGYEWDDQTKVAKGHGRSIVLELINEIGCRFCVTEDYSGHVWIQVVTTRAHWRDFLRTVHP